MTRNYGDVFDTASVDRCVARTCVDDGRAFINVWLTIRSLSFSLSSLIVTRTRAARHPPSRQEEARGDGQPAAQDVAQGQAGGGGGV